MLKKLLSLFSEQNLSLGKQGEDKACQYLKKLGYTILEQNWKSHPYEIDIICLDKKQDELVFVEVKTRKKEEQEYSLEAFTSQKQRNIIKGAQKYLSQKQKWDCPCRFDLICINGKNMDLEHFCNVIIQ